MQAAGLLELQCRFLRRRQAQATVEHEQVVGLDQAVGQRAPVGLPCRTQRLRQFLQCAQQRRVVLPVRAELQDRRQRGQVALGRGHALLRAGAERDHRIGQLRQRRILDVDQRHHARAGVLGGLRVAQQVRALARLRDHQVQRPAQLQRRFVHRAHRRRGRGGDHAELGLEQVLGVGGGVVGTAARTGHHERRRRGAQRRGERAHGGVVAFELRGDDRGGFRGFTEHQGFGFGGQRHGQDHVGSGEEERRECGCMGAVEPRTTSCGTKPWLCTGAGWSS
ncbi:hypothetical protein NB689_001233 [Xanthomonas sacchari]|nr:hypothetical protein [Xanthomonas sacchari]